MTREITKEFRNEIALKTVAFIKEMIQSEEYEKDNDDHIDVAGTIHDALIALTDIACCDNCDSKDKRHDAAANKALKYRIC